MAGGPGEGPHEGAVAWIDADLLGHHNKVPYGLGDLTDIYFLIVLEAGSLKRPVQSGSGWDLVCSYVITKHIHKHYLISSPSSGAGRARIIVSLQKERLRISSTQETVCGHTDVKGWKSIFEYTSCDPMSVVPFTTKLCHETCPHNGYIIQSLRVGTIYSNSVLLVWPLQCRAQVFAGGIITGHWSIKQIAS